MSGSFHETVDRLAEQLGIDYVKGQIVWKSGAFSDPDLGRLSKDTKLAMLKAWAAENKLELSRTIAMGRRQ